MAVPGPASARMAAAGPSGRTAAVPKSGTARAPGRSGKGPAAGASARGGKSGGAKRASGGKELIIAAGVLGILVIAVVFFYFLRNDQAKQVEHIKEERQQAEKDNWKLAKEKIEAADQVAHLWCQGTEDTPEDKLKAPFVSDDTVYNVIYTRKKKDKRGKEDEKSVAVHDERMGSIGSLSTVNDDVPNVHMEYAFVEGRTVAVIRAVMSIPSKDGDPLNMGGSITVLSKAKEDDHFKRAREVAPKTPDAAAAPGAPAEK